MGIINRDLAQSSQRAQFELNSGPLATGATALVCTVPWPSSLDMVEFSAFGISGTPTATLYVNRFVVGAGATAFAVGNAQTLQAFGTSGAVLGVSMPQIGATLVTLQTNDVLMYQTGGANSAVTGLSANVVLRPLVDILKWYGNI